jgi:hypothetical protein|nr:MAG TPA: hypothetical protein [Caudoviricetes sp.]
MGISPLFFFIALSHSINETTPFDRGEDKNMLNREHSQITYEDLRRFLEHLRIEYRRYTLDHVSSSSRTIINVDADFGNKINVGDVITVDRNHKYSLATQSAIQIESPLLVVIQKISDTELEVLSHGVASVKLPRLDNKSILYLGNDGRLTTTKEDNRINYAMGMYVDDLLLIYPRNLLNREKDFLVKVGLGNVDNTSDMDKPISNATRAEFDRVMSTIRFLDESLRRKLEDHITDHNVHVSDTDRNHWNSARETLQSHITNESIHTSNAERAKWNDMTPMEKFLEHINNTTIHPAIGGYDQLDLRYVKNNDLTTKLSEYTLKSELGNYISATKLNDVLQGYVKTGDLSEYATRRYVDDAVVKAVAGNIDLSSYVKEERLKDYMKKADAYTKTETNKAIDDAVKNLSATIPPDVVRKPMLDEYIRKDAIGGTNILTIYTEHKIAVLDVDNDGDILPALHNYGESGAYYFGQGAAASKKIFNTKTDNSGNIVIDQENLDILPMNSIAVLDKKIKVDDVKPSPSGLLIKDVDGLHFINLITEVNSGGGGGSGTTVDIIDDTRPRMRRTYSSAKVESILSQIQSAIQSNRSDINIHGQKIRLLDQSIVNQDLIFDPDTMEKTPDGKVTVRTASGNNRGVIKIDNNTLRMTGDVLSTKEYRGDTDTIVLDPSGEIRISPKIMQELSDINARVNGAFPEDRLLYATLARAGIVRPDNETLIVGEKGVLSVKNPNRPATTGTIGHVKPDGDTIAIDSNGTISVRNQINKLVQLSDVSVDDLKRRIGQVLTVNANGTGFILSNPYVPTNAHFEKVIQSPTEYEFVYDFSIHINNAISATLDITNLNMASDAKIKFIGRNGGELIEAIKGSYHLTIPEREFYVSISLQGNVKVMIDVLSFN